MEKKKKFKKVRRKIIIKFNIFLIIIFFVTIIFFNIKKEKNNNKENNVIGEHINVNVQNDMNIIETDLEIQKEVNSNTTDWEVILVNKNNKIPENYNVNLSNIENNHKTDSRIVDNLKNMLSDARKTGLDPIICSSYRSNYIQTKLYNNKVRQYINKGYDNEKSKELASYWVTIPKTSEHEIGLAVDIVSKSYQILDERQENTEVQKWLIENSYKYGFVLRYPTDKKDITMINYEPWHYRYVGLENARYMKENNICLEEYIEYLKKFDVNDILV